MSITLSHPSNLCYRYGALGYGHSAPETMAGRLFCILFALAGIPMGLIMFQSIGERVNTFIAFCLHKVIFTVAPLFLELNWMLSIWNSAAFLPPISRYKLPSRGHTHTFTCRFAVNWNQHHHCRSVMRTSIVWDFRTWFLLQEQSFFITKSVGHSSTHTITVL